MSYNSTHTGAQIDAAVDAVETKQDRLVSGTNIKTINGQSVMGSGNLSIEATGVYECTYGVTTYADAVAAIQAGKTPIVKMDMDEVTELIFTLEQWDNSDEFGMLHFSSKFIDKSEAGDVTVTIMGLLLKATPDSSTMDSGWTTPFYKQVLSPVEIHSATCTTSAAASTKVVAGSRQNFRVLEGTLFFIRFSSGNTHTSGTCNLNIDNAPGVPDYNYPLKWRGGALPAFAANTIAIVVFNAASSIFELVGFDDVYTKAEVDAKLSAKQDTLTSGTNIKTINGESVLGSGDITTLPVDYVIEEDTEGIYHWRKWASGKSEVWGYYRGSNTHYATTSSWYARYFDWSFPSGVFINPMSSDDNLPNAQFTAHVGSGYSMTAGISYNPSPNTLRTYVLSSASGAQTCAVWLYAEGRWK